MIPGNSKIFRILCRHDLSFLGGAVIGLLTLMTVTAADVSGQCLQTVLSGRVEELEKMSFADPANGMIGTREGVVLRTSNGGYSWIEQDIRYGSSLRIHGVSMVDSTVAYAVTSEGEVLKTTDGGLNWDSKGKPTGTYLYGVSFADEDHGAVAGGAGKIGFTTDGGASWSLDSLGNITFFDAVCTGGGTIYAVGSAGTVVRSSDSGATWLKRTGNFSETIRSISVTSGGVAYAVGFNSAARPVLLKTINGGTTWSYQDTEFDKILHDVSFLDQDRGVACGEGALLSTRDGGTTWQIHPMYGFGSVNHIRFLPTGDIIAAGIHNTFKNSIIKIAKNGCALPFTLVSPKNYAADISIWKNMMFPKSVTFSWRFYSQVRFSSARVQISRDPGFEAESDADTIIKSVIDEGDTTVIIPVLSPKQTYYWRTAFNNIDGTQSSWSNISRFTTAGGAIIGLVYEDGDRDGMRDPDELTFSNWPLQITGDADVALYTNGNGEFEIAGLDSGNYTVSDLGSPLWRRIKPDSGYYRFVLPADSIAAGCDFGYYFPWNSIKGSVFNDANEDGIRSESDSGLFSWRVRFSGPMGSDSVLTDGDGYYLFPRVTTGPCTVSVVPKDGWEQIYPRLGKAYIHYFYDYDQQLFLDFSLHRIPQRVKNILNFHDNRTKPVVILYWGVREGATSGVWGADPMSSLIDYSEGELEIPPPLPGAMDARFVSPPYAGYEFGLGSWTDIRPYLSASQTDTYLVRFAAGTYEGGDYPVTFSWSSSDVGRHYSSTVLLAVPPEMIIDMRDQDSVVINNPDLSVIRIIASGPNNSPDAVDRDLSQIPARYLLGQNYPNPFNPATKISYALPTESYVSLRVYDLLGREVAILAEGSKPAGIYSVVWDATDCGSGIYLYRMEAACRENPKSGYTQIRKMLIVR